MPQMTQPLRAIALPEQRSTGTGLLWGVIQALRQQCGLCGHSRLWHHAHMIRWGRD